MQGFHALDQIFGPAFGVVGEREETKILGQPRCYVGCLAKLTNQYFERPGD